MENYVLWGASPAGSPRQVSFFATPVHVQRINLGTKEMIEEMLKDAGVGGDHVEEWTVRRFFTNYMVDDDSEDWEDVWAETWEINARVAADVTLAPGDIALKRTYARDHTWNGQSGPMLPGECVVVADFPDARAVGAAADIIGALQPLRTDPSAAAGLRSRVPQAPVDLFVEIRKAYEQYAGAPPPSTRRREGYPLQLIISLGEFDESYFAGGATLAMRVCDLCRSLSGTTTWNELNLTQ